MLSSTLATVVAPFVDTFPSATGFYLPAGYKRLHQTNSNSKSILSSCSTLQTTNLGKESTFCKGDVRDGSLRLSADSRSRKTFSRASRLVTSAGLQALVFECDGVVLNSAGLHRLAYNLAFRACDIRMDNLGPMDWTQKEYDGLHSAVREAEEQVLTRYFARYGWPVSQLIGAPPQNNKDQRRLIGTIVQAKNEAFQALMADHLEEEMVAVRPGVLRLMDEAKQAGCKIGVCTMGDRQSAEMLLRRGLGEERFHELDVVLGASDFHLLSTAEDPASEQEATNVYSLAAKRLGLEGAPRDCVVVEHRDGGVDQVRQAGLRCIVTYTESTKNGKFSGAERIVSSLGESPAEITVSELKRGGIVQDDRTEFIAPQ